MDKKDLFTSKMNFYLKTHEMFGLECGSVCSRDMDTDESGCLTVGGF